MKTPSAPRIKIDRDRREVFIRGRELALPPKEYLILEVLVSTNKAMTRHELLKVVWGHSEPIDTRTIDQHVARLRRKLRGDRDLIKTVSDHGYKYCA